MSDPDNDLTAMLGVPISMLSLRDWFAGQALAGFLADGAQRLVNLAVKKSEHAHLINDHIALTGIVNEQIALGMYAMADAMIAARSRGDE